MRVTGIDARKLVREGRGANFVVFIYEGGDAPNASWSVDSYLLTDTDLPHVRHWLRQNLPVDSCWCLGVVLDPALPTAESDVNVRWVVGADVLNMAPRHWSSTERRMVEEMLARRHRVALP
ncbi:MAG: hypothetical protein WKF76_04845 [Nocardioidaceae bacterium]